MRFELPGGGHALFTARVDGNLSSVSGAEADLGEAARERLRTHLGVCRLLRGYQVHGTTVLRTRSEDEISAHDSVTAQPPLDADGQATLVVGIGAMVLTADCLPVALGCSGAVAMIHAGWRGLASGVLEEGVRAVRELGGEDAIVAIVGPGAGQCCYEVGEEVHGVFGGAHRAGRNIDLKAIARERLLAAGAGEVRDVDICTICDERFFSHRREGARAGRQGGVAWRDLRQAPSTPGAHFPASSRGLAVDLASLRRISSSS